MNNSIVGNDGAQTIYGGAGNDHLLGGRGIDTYVFHSGDGQDVIIERGNLEKGNNDVSILRFTDQTLAELTIRREGYYFVISHGNGDSIELRADGDIPDWPVSNDHAWHLIDKNGAEKIIRISDDFTESNLPDGRPAVHLADGSTLNERVVNQYLENFYRLRPDGSHGTLNISRVAFNEIAQNMAMSTTYTRQPFLDGYWQSVPLYGEWKLFNTQTSSRAPGADCDYVIDGRRYRETVTLLPSGANSYDTFQISTFVWESAKVWESYTSAASDNTVGIPEVNLSGGGFRTPDWVVKVNGSDGADQIYLHDGFTSPRQLNHQSHLLGAVIDAGAGDDIVVGSLMDDEIIGGAGNDVIDGRLGSDNYWIDTTTGSGHDIIDDTGYADLDAVFSLKNVYGYSDVFERIQLSEYGRSLGYGYNNYNGYQYNDWDVDSVILAGGLTMADISVEWTNNDQALILRWRNDASVTIPVHYNQEYSYTVTSIYSGSVYWNDIEPYEWRFTGKDLHIGIDRVVFDDGSYYSIEELMAIASSNGANHAPEAIGDLESQQANSNQAWQYVIPVDAFRDIDGDVLTYTVTLADGSPLPSWISFDAASRTLSGTPDNNVVGDLSLKVTATDTGGLSANQALTLTIAAAGNQAPEFSGILPDLMMAPLYDDPYMPSMPMQFWLPSYSFSDPDGDMLNYSLTLADGSELPAWLQFDPYGMTLSASPGQNDIGLINLRLTATDGGGLSNSQTFSLRVNNAPTLSTGIPVQRVVEGQFYQLTLPQDLFVDPDGDTLSMQISQLDGSPLPAWLHYDANTRTLSGTAPERGLVGLRIRATDQYGAISDYRLGVTINSNPGLHPGERIVQVNGGIPTLTDAAERIENSNGGIIYAKGGNDTIITFGGIVHGEAGDDYIESINGGSLWGDAGNDTIITDNGSAFGGDGNDTIIGLNGGSLYGDAGDDYIESHGFGSAFGGTGNDHIISFGNGSSFGDAGDDYLESYGTGSVYGGDGNDTILANGGSAFGGNGNDHIINYGNGSLYGDAGDDYLESRGTGNAYLSGGDGNDTLISARGSMYGGKGNDLLISTDADYNNYYSLNSGDGHDRIRDAGGNNDYLSISANNQQLWFSREGNNLRIDCIGTTDGVTIEGWYSDNGQHQIERIYAGGKSLVLSQVDSLVQAMASFAPPAPGQMTMPDAYQNALNPVLATSWK